jgi:hypothetical protein
LAEIADFLKREMEGFGKARVKESLANYGISYDALKSELEGRGYFIEKDGSISKTWNRFWNGHASYVVRKGAQSITAGDGIEFDAGSVKVETTSWTPRNGVNVYDLKVEGREQAKVIHCDPTKTKVVIAAERSGVVDMADVEKKYGRRYIFSAPVSMTTGNRKLTQIAFNEGIQINYLLTVGSFDGLIIVDSNGGQKVLNKQGIRLSELVSEEDLSNPAIKGSFERWCIKNGCKGSDGKIDFRKALDSLIRPANKIGDRRLFFDILKTKKMGLLSNLLLVDGDKTDHLNDGADSRRLYLEFSDGSFGIIDSTVNMSSNNAVDLARAYAKNRGLTLTGAVYMDTGMYDMANFVDGGGNKHVLGWEDTDNSSNRLIIVSRE